MTKNIIALFCSFWLALSYVFAQSDKISGFYKGYITQNTGGLADKYLMELSISIDKKGKVIGTSFFKLFDSEEMIVRYSLKGNLKKNTLILEEISIDESKIREGYYFCIKKMALQVEKKEFDYFLQGSWTADNCPYIFGEIFLKKEEVF